MPFRKLGGKFHFFLRFCTRKRSKTYICVYMYSFSKHLTYLQRNRQELHVSSLQCSRPQILLDRSGRHDTERMLCLNHIYPCKSTIIIIIHISNHFIKIQRYIYDQKKLFHHEQLCTLPPQHGAHGLINIVENRNTLSLAKTSLVVILCSR